MNTRKTLLALFCIIIFWCLISFIGIIKPVFLPTPIEIPNAIFELVQNLEFYKHIFHTLWRTFISFSIASLIGIPIGLLLGYFIKIRGYFEMIIDFFRTMPSPALIPLSLVIFGIGDLAKIVVVTFSISLIIIVNTIYGVQNIKETRKKLFNSLQATESQRFTKLILPESMPHIMSGLRIALSLSLIIVVVTEMIIGTHFGLGYIIQTEQLLYNIPEMYVYIIILGVIGYILNQLFVYYEKKLLFWTSE